MRDRVWSIVWRSIVLFIYHLVMRQRNGVYLVVGGGGDEVAYDFSLMPSGNQPSSSVGA